MSDKIDVKKLKKLAEELIKKIDSEAKIGTVSQIEDTVAIEIKSPDAEILIGQNGETLQAIQHLLRVMSRKVCGSSCFIDLDVNDYRKKRKDYLKELAISTANEVSLSNKEISLPPMNSYERRIVHMALVERHDVVTESRGCDADRRIVIKLAG